MVIGRVCGEGKDLPVVGASDAGGNMLSISAEEKDILRKLAELKAAGFLKKIVLLLNTANAVELDVIEPAVCGEDFGIDACLWVGEVGQSGIRAIGDLLSGKINPSGRLVDTYCYDNTTSPAVQNAYVTSYTNAAEKGLAFAKTNNEYYVVYQEGIYIGYRYYETRYEDAVLGNANVGDYDYAKTVAFPFGYGLNYSNLSYGKLNMKENGDTFDFTVDVTNPSDRDAREAVLIYMQSPYTDYDKQNGIEKAAVELVGYTKIDVPAGKTVTANVSVAKSEMRAYDANGAKTYIVDEGNYYFATGNGAHEALNNILMQKAAQSDTLNGAVDSAKMVGEGRADLAVVYKQAKQDTTTYATSRTGFAITNQLDHGDLNKFDADASNDIKYLTPRRLGGHHAQSRSFQQHLQGRRADGRQRRAGESPEHHHRFRKEGHHAHPGQGRRTDPGPLHRRAAGRLHHPAEWSDLHLGRPDGSGEVQRNDQADRPDLPCHCRGQVRWQARHQG